MTFSFQATVSDDAMRKVGRLFNASLDDILNELLQNARRSGATRVTITQLVHKDSGSSICFADNGPGLANPVALFTLGRSAWDASVVASEDAAGFGFFSLANRGAQIIAQKQGTDCSWLLEASPAAFSGDEPVIGHEGPSHQKRAIYHFSGARPRKCCCCSPACRPVLPS